MLSQTLLPILLRDLDRMEAEIHAFTNEPDLWRTPAGVTNSAGNLCLHVCGNLQHFIGAVLGGTGYVRDREREFKTGGIPRQELIDITADTRRVLENTLTTLSDEELALPYPIMVLADDMSTAQFLVHLQGHLNYHLGQMNYLRRFMEASGNEVRG